MDSRAAQPEDFVQTAHQTPERQAIHHPHTSLGVAGHWIRTAGILAPLIIGEVVKDTEKRWRWIRIASVATALFSEGLYAHRIQQERARCEDRNRQR